MVNLGITMGESRTASRSALPRKEKRSTAKAKAAPAASAMVEAQTMTIIALAKPFWKSG